MTRLASSLIVVLALLVAAPAHAGLGFGVRGGVSSEPDQILVGGHLRLTSLIPSAPALWFEPNATAGFGDHLTTVQVSGDVKYGLPVGRLTIAPLFGLSYVHYTIDSDLCDDCSDGRFGIHLGVGLLYGKFGVDLVIALSDDLPDARIMAQFNF